MGSSSSARVRPFDPRTDMNRVIAFHVDLMVTNFPPNGLIDPVEYDNALRQEAFSPGSDFQKAVSSADSKANGIFVWDEGSRIVGYIWLQMRRDPRLDLSVGVIREIYVVPERRGMGLASKIMTFAEGWFASRGAKVARLDVTASNERAVGLYKKLGYRITRYEMERTIGE